MQALSNQPLVAMIHASPQFKAHVSKDEFDGPCSNDYGEADHAVLIVGYSATHCESPGKPALGIVRVQQQLARICHSWGGSLTTPF